VAFQRGRDVGTPPSERVVSANVNPFERMGRDRKIERLLGAVLTIERETGVSKQAHCAFWRRANEQQWAVLALLSASRKISPITRAEFLEEMSKRAGVI
jgi:hypothetical protein